MMWYCDDILVCFGYCLQIESATTTCNLVHLKIVLFIYIYTFDASAPDLHSPSQASDIEPCPDHLILYP